MKKKILISIFLIFLMPRPALAIFPVVDWVAIGNMILDYAMQGKALVESTQRTIGQATQIYNQAKMIEQNIRNLEKLSDLDWDNFMDVLNNYNTIYNRFESLGYQAQNAADQIDHFYKKAENYKNNALNAASSLEFVKNVKETYADIFEQGRNNAKSTIESLGLSFDGFKKNDYTRKQIKDRIANASGNLQGLQAIGDSLIFLSELTEKSQMATMNLTKYLTEQYMNAQAKAEAEQGFKEALRGDVTPKPTLQEMRGSNKNRLLRLP